MSFLDFPGLQYFYNKYLKPIKPHAREETIKSYTVNEQGHVPDAQLVVQLKEENESLQEEIEKLNSALGGLALIDDTGISGETVLTMQNSMGSEHLYIVCVRMLNGSTGLFGPWAYLLYMRPQNWDYALIGEEQNVVDKDIQNGKLTITFSEECWVRMVTYRIF